MQPHESTLICTLGGQAQVVTFALDWLLRRGERIREVIVLHLAPSDPRVAQALAQLAAEFVGDRYQNQPCRLRLLPLRQGERKLSDIRSEAEAEVTWQTVYQVLHTLKAQGRSLHLCIAGGRRMMGLLAVSAAMLLCGHHDRVWHMYTPRPFLERAQEGAIMHARPEDGVRLIQVPLVPWGAYFPALRALAQAPPAQVIATQMRWLDQAERERCQTVIGQLTPRQVEVLGAFAGGKTPQEVAEALTIELATVDTHKTPILAACRNVWAIPDEIRMDYHFLRDRFGPFLGDLL